MWYLNEAEESNSDGHFTNYEGLRPCADVLYGQLSRILQNSTRNLSAVETNGILPSGTLFYREPLPFPEKPCFSAGSRALQTQSREAWFIKGFQRLSNVELVFLDPDNGVAGKRVKKYSQKSVKYAFLDETTGWLNRNQSVIERSICRLNRAACNSTRNSNGDQTATLHDIYRSALQASNDRGSRVTRGEIVRRLLTRGQ
jgi:hypothetical protein